MLVIPWLTSVQTCTRFLLHNVSNVRIPFVGNIILWADCKWFASALGMFMVMFSPVAVNVYVRFREGPDKCQGPNL